MTRRGPGRWGSGFVAVVTAVAVGSWYLGGWGEADPVDAGPPPALPGPPARPPILGPEAQARLEEGWGIRLESLRPVAAGYALDLRYWVVDPAKAAPILQRKLAKHPHLIVQKSGATLGVPRSRKVGSLRQSVRTPNQIKKDTRYFVLFANPARHVQSGDEVTLVIGDLTIQHLRVM